MPTYTYQCKQCETKIEYFQSIIDKPLTVCPSCQGILHRVITGGSGIIFKGSGFYITDYKNKQTIPSEKPESIKKPEKPKKSENKEKATKTT